MAVGVSQNYPHYDIIKMELVFPFSEVKEMMSIKPISFACFLTKNRLKSSIKRSAVQGSYLTSF